ncbi:Beta-barrel assembly-enhancing protease [Paraglaciecola mesophila]|uniref:Beta-barrel assembly-enhancing protease n=2 Tax=Paraglaciecola mesophila TaxID=197222 RepID=A0A857JNL4_9ALTE|nr:Beta-barrel assembly-enhancing protease [Paraglaciecola mesophila]
MKIYCVMFLLIVVVSTMLFAQTLHAAPITSLQAEKKEHSLTLAQEAWNNGDIPLAKKHFQTLLARAPNNVKALIGLAQVEEALGNTKIAKAHFITALGLSPKSPDLYTAYGRFLLKQNHIEQAIEALESALAINPRLPEANVELAVIKLSRFGDAQAAVQLYRKALEEAPSDISYLYGLSLAYERSGDLTAAIETLNIITELNPSLALAYKLKGNYAQIIKNYPLSITSFKSALEKAKKPTVQDHLSLADVLTESGHIEQAISTYQHIIKTYGEHEITLTKLAYVYHTLGDYKSAEKNYLKAITLNNTYAEPYNNLAYLALDNDDPHKALKLAKKAVNYSSDNPNYLDTLGIVYMNLTEFHKARNAFQLAVNMAPNNSEFQENLMRANQAY